MKLIITVDVPEHQIGQEVSVYFKDTMCVKSVCTPLTESDDCVSRQAVKNEIMCWIGSGEYRYAMSERFLFDRINELPPVYPQNDVLDKIRAEIEEHRNKTEYMDKYDLVGDCLDIINKYRKVEE